ncbi:MAG TPA: hypothetical protein VK142_07575 [Bacillota bacterium]|nr:hypothetical protein [Bacillota bacterium]
MAIEVFGCFETKDDAIKEVEVLSLKGIPSNNIMVFTSGSAEELGKNMDGIIENPEKSNGDDLKTKFKKISLKIQDNDKSFQEALLDVGLSEQQATRYGEEIQAGNILVIAENKLKMGHDSTPNTSELEVPVIGHENN